jgi:hypothetical protein
MRNERDRAWRRKQTRRVVANRSKMAKSWNWPIEKPGWLKKWNFTCDCGVCKKEKYSRAKDKKQARDLIDQECSEIIYN